MVILNAFANCRWLLGNVLWQLSSSQHESYWSWRKQTRLWPCPHLLHTDHSPVRVALQSRPDSDHVHISFILTILQSEWLFKADQTQNHCFSCVMFWMNVINIPSIVIWWGQVELCRPICFYFDNSHKEKLAILESVVVFWILQQSGIVFWMLQLAHHEEKLAILEQSLTTTQEQLSQRVGDIVRLEQIQRKLSTELKTIKERAASYEDEIASQKDTIGLNLLL